jgi:hypothetical protein
MTVTEFAATITADRAAAKARRLEALRAVRVASLKAHGVKLDKNGKTRNMRGHFTPDPILER